MKISHLLLIVALTVSTTCANQKSPSVKSTGDTLSRQEAVSDSSCTHPLLYEITLKGKKAYLFGSVHFGSPDFYPLASVIDSVFILSKNLVVEINSEAPDFAKKSQALFSKGMLKGDKTLKDVLSKKGYAEVVKALEGYNLTIEQFSKFEPWLLALTLESIDMQASGLQNEYGIDLHFMAKAQKSNKEILQIETVEKQVALLQELNSESFLLYSIKDRQKNREIVGKLMQAFRCGREDQLEKLVFEDFSDEIANYNKLFKKLVTDRNYTMADYVTSYLDKNSGPAFVVVGAGHVIGSEGIVEILRKRGAEVKKL